MPSTSSNVVYCMLEGCNFMW